jgi:hypothetical protein
MKRIDPIKYNLSPRTTLYKKMGVIFIIIDRKSRIIMKDGNRIFKQSKVIWSVEPSSHIKVATSAPVCTKTREYLRKADIEVLELNSLNIKS